ncbi:MAG TPA: DinB family protein [candidate division Zixibacteria bacterium]|nr:DinB family protein [candidate division Zixibacteria bacterium]
MNPRVAPFADLYKFDTTIFNNALKDIKPEDLHKRPSNNCASLNWLAGHLVNSRYYIAHLIGGSDEYEFSNLYNGDGQPLKEPSAYLPIGEIQKAFDSISEKLMKRLNELNDSDIDKKLKDKWPHGDDTHFGAISFMCWHEGWHIGQMSVLRKHLGYKGLAG